jgi:hypothetical protein
MKRYLLFALLSLSLALVLSACQHSQDESKTITTQKFSNGVTVTLLNGNGKIKEGDNDFVLLFKDAGGQPVDVGNAVASINMPAMGTMGAMNSMVQLSSVSIGKYHAKLDVEMKGAWTMTVQFAGKAGEGKTTFNINAE